MDRFEHEILDFMRSWVPYGGPPPDEEVMPEFGMTREQLIDCFNLILATESARRERERQRPWLRIQAR